MDDLNELIAMTDQLCQTLYRMSEQERRFGWEIGAKLSDMSYETYKIAEDLKAINSMTVGGKI